MEEILSSVFVTEIQNITFHHTRVPFGLVAKTAVVTVLQVNRYNSYFSNQTFKSAI